MTSPLLLVLLRKLAAGRINVRATRVANRGLNANGGKRTNEKLGLLGGGGLELGALEVVELDEVHVREGAAREVAEGIELVGVVIHAADEGVLVRGPASGLLDVLLHDLVKAAERVLAHARHELVACGLDGGVQRDGERELLGLLGKAADHGNDAAGRDREMAGADAGSVGGVEHAQRGEHVVVVVERLALAHHDDARDTRLEVVGNVRDLVKHLGGRERARETAHAGGAEYAAHAAPRLGGDADGEAVARGHADALGTRAVRVLDEVLAATVVGHLSRDLRDSAKGAALGELLAKRRRNVAHLVKG